MEGNAKALEYRSQWRRITVDGCFVAFAAVIYASATQVSVCSRLKPDLRSGVSSNYARGRELIVAHIRAPASPTSATSIEQRFMVLRHFEQHGFKMARDN